VPSIRRERSPVSGYPFSLMTSAPPPPPGSWQQPPVQPTPPWQQPPVQPEAPAPPPAPPARGRPRIVDALIEIVTTVALAVILYLVIQTFIVQTFRVEQQSMMTTLHPDQHLLIDKLTPRWDDYSRGDIIVFKAPGRYSADGTPFIKRVIGVAGDRVEVKEDGAWIDGIRLVEPYVDGYPTQPEGKESSWEVGPGELFVMGDHRDASVDSRSFGVIRVDDVIGRALIRFWPPNTLGIVQTPTYPELEADAAP